MSSPHPGQSMIYQHDQPPLDRVAYRKVWGRRIQHTRVLHHTQHDWHALSRDLHPDYDWEVRLGLASRREHRADACRVRAAEARKHPRPWPPEFEDAP